MCGGGGGSGQRALEQEEKDLLRMQTRVAEQGIVNRDLANAGYRSFVQRGRERGSIQNQNLEADRFRQDATAGFGTAQRMQDTRMASMGVNAGDPRFTRGRDTAGVGFAGQTASGMNAARAGARSEGLKLEGAGYTGLAGNDPTGALNSMGATINGANNRAMSADQAGAAGWGALGQGAMYGLANADKIGKGFNTVGGWFPGGGGGGMSDAAAASFDTFADGGMVRSYAEGGEVMGVQRFAAGGNVYDRAMGDVSQANQMIRPRGPAPQEGGMGIDPITATNIASKMVNKAAADTALAGKYAMAPAGYSSTGLKFGADAGASLGAGTAGEGAGMGLKMGADAGAMMGAEAGAAGAGTGLSTAGLAGAEAAGAGAAGAGLATVGAALPWVGLALAAGSALDLFADGGQVGIGRPQGGGPAANPKGGKVSGPGGPKDDMVPAYLSPGEFVLPVGAVRKFGLDRLEKMRQAGLEFEKQQGIA